MATLTYNRINTILNKTPPLSLETVQRDGFCLSEQISDLHLSQYELLPKNARNAQTR